MKISSTELGKLLIKLLNKVSIHTLKIIIILLLNFYGMEVVTKIGGR